MDDVLSFGNGSCSDALQYKEVLNLYMKSIGMVANAQNYSRSFNGIQRTQEITIK
jgi:hypothetical protein